VREAYGEVGLLTGRGTLQSGRESRMVSLLAERRRHAAEVTRRKTVESKTYTVEEAVAFYTALGAAVRRHVPDTIKTREEVVRAIQDAMAAIGGRSSLTPDEAGPE